MAVFLCILLVYLTKHFPRGVIYSILGIFTALILTIGGMVYPIGYYQITILCIIAVGLYVGLLLYCFKRHLKVALVIFKIAGAFITENLQVFLIPLTFALINYAMMVLEIGSLFGVLIMSRLTDPV